MSSDDRSTIERAVATFVDACNDLDRVRIEACFTAEATVFDAWGGKRKNSFWSELFDTWRATRQGPPYLSLEAHDLQVQDLGETAVVTFHTAAATAHVEIGDNIVRRRTIVLTHLADGWKIAHLHASNMPLAT